MKRWLADKPKAVIVIVHGAFEYHGRYKWLVEMWRSTGYHVIMGDLPGQGLTTRRRGHIEAFDEYIEEVGNWIREAQTYKLPIALLGHSMGGLVTIRSLQETEVNINCIVLSSPCLGIMQKPSKIVDFLSRGMNIFTPSLKYQPKLTVDMVTRNKEIQHFEQNDSLYVRKISVRWYRELMLAIEEAYKQIEKFPDIPLLVLQGGEDKVVDKQKVRKWFNEVDLKEKMYKEWEGYYHEIFNEEKREQVFELAEWFVQQHVLPYNMN
ncbi:alpha/beta hydrolase [Bacillus carboniphilus]|uniref:Alpha/beta hydrolase n=1 Tax=Bacillus carboniphilus TaxID=86663 RepID=A0ABY9JQT9_9BACI|nr:alpha/beta hydrolase [Bacillus carboniphilus]WLR41174.1 alpha/beta hydrolase [Bacillus carboniphilus]